MEDFGEWRKKDEIQSRRLSIIDFSSEDDSLLGASSESLGQRSEDIFQSFDDDRREELFERVSANKLQEIPETEELVPQLSECSEPEMVRKNGKCNLRKSLAWDSAFLTCEGIMDADELSSMISIDKSQGRMLPGIQEEVYKSTDSISTLGSDTLTLESVESSLFEDVRASIQRSRNPVKMSGGNNVVLGVREAKVGSAVKKVGLASQTKLKPKVVAKNPIISMQIPGKLPRQVRGSQQLSQSMATTKESSSSLLKWSNVLDKPVPSSARMAKRASLGGDLLKAQKDNTKVVAGRGAHVPKIPGSLRNVPRPTKSSSLGASSSNTTGPTSSIESSGSTSSVKSFMNPLNSMKKPAYKTGNPTSSSRSTPKTQSRAMSGDRIETGKSRLSAQSMLSPRMSSNISPASSISDWSSESISSISSTQHISHSSRDSLSRSCSSKKVPVDFDSPRCMDRDDKTSDRSASRGLPGNSTSRVSIGMVALHQTSKPSGLRLPSPKLGFFDGAKSTVRTTPKRSIPVAPSNVPKAGASVGTSPRGSGIKSKLGKVKLEKAGTIAGAKTDASISIMKPKIYFSPESLEAATKEVKSGSVTPPLLKTSSPLIVDEEDHSNGDEVGNGGSDMGLENKDDGFCENNETADAFKSELILETQYSAPREEVGNGGDGMSSYNKDISFCENNETTDALKAELILETQRSAHQADVKIGGLSNSSPASNFEIMRCLEELTTDEFKLDKEDYDNKGGEVGSGCGYDLGLRDKDTGFSEINEIAGKSLEDVKITGLSIISPASDSKNVNYSDELARENSDSENQIDCLIRQLGSMEIRVTEGMLLDEMDNNDGVLQLNSSQDITVSVEKEESQNSLPKPIIFISPESDKRIPFSAKDSVCNIGASIGGEKTSQLSPPFSEDHFETEQLS